MQKASALPLISVQRMDFFRGALPLEKICRFLLNDKFSKVLKRNVTKDQLKLDLTSGTLIVSDVDLNPSIFNTGRKLLLVRAARIDNVHIQMAGKVITSVCIFMVLICARLPRASFPIQFTTT
jgi:hypothetical protein